ncbi:MAG TPA: hypothetical protein VEI57_14875 [Nitrospirota bacterium]|nr:hypothetical protein [Nitrospirota bacterium]
MKKRFLIFVAISAVMMLSAGRASAFTHYTVNEFMTAESLDPGMTQTGIDFSLGDHFTSYYPEVRYGLGALLEVGARFGAVQARLDNGQDLGFLAGADLKYQLIKETEGVPVDLAVDLGWNNMIIDGKNASELTFATLASKSIALTDRGYKLVPYGGLALSGQFGSLADNDKSYINVFVGLEWKLTQKFMVLLEVKAGDQITGGAGIRFEY